MKTLKIKRKKNSCHIIKYIDKFGAIVKSDCIEAIPVTFNKLKYNTQKEAQKRVQELIKKEGCSFAEYKCKSCHKFHVGHRIV